jgi:hypothetical protein
LTDNHGFLLFLLYALLIVTLDFLWRGHTARVARRAAVVANLPALASPTGSC